MLLSVLNQIKLICPECRRLTDKGMKVSTLELKHVTEESSNHIMSGTLSCMDCWHEYPIVGGIPCIIRDFDKWMAQQNLPDEKPMMDVFKDFHYGEDSRPDWAENKKYWETMIDLAPHEGQILDLGCSVGRWTFELARKCQLAVGLDTRLSALKIAVDMQIGGDMPDNVIFIAGDALDPPFLAGYFDHVSALNILDNVPYPLTLLGQMDALLRPGGDMLLASPYEWRNDITPREEWLGLKQVRNALQGKDFPECQFNYSIKTEKDVGWTMRNHARYYSHFISHVIQARKVSPG